MIQHKLKQTKLPWGNMTNQPREDFDKPHGQTWEQLPIKMQNARGDEIAGCHFPCELTDIVRMKSSKSQDILLKIFHKSIYLLKSLYFSTKLCLIPIKKVNILICITLKRYNWQIWDKVLPFAGSQEKNDDLWNWILFMK